MISGANRGIGLKIAEKLYEEGFSLSLGTRQPFDLNEDHDRVASFHFDATIAETAKEWVDKTAKRFGKIDALINNAGIVRTVTLDNVDEDTLDELFEVNVKAPYRMICHALPYLRKSGEGRIVNLVSLSGKRVVGRSPGYSMSKFALLALTHSARFAGWDDGVRATALCPGLVDTEMVQGIAQIEPEEMTKPEDIAELVASILTLPNTASVSEMTVNCLLERTY